MNHEIIQSVLLASIAGMLVYASCSNVYEHLPPSNLTPNEQKIMSLYNLGENSPVYTAEKDQYFAYIAAAKKIADKPMLRFRKLVNKSADPDYQIALPIYLAAIDKSTIAANKKWASFMKIYNNRTKLAEDLIRREMARPRSFQGTRIN